MDAELLKEMQARGLLQKTDIDDDLFSEMQSRGLIDESGRLKEPTKKEPEKGFFTRVGEDLTQRGKKVVGIAKRKGIYLLPETIALGVGQVAGGIGDITGEALRSTYKTIVPESTQESIKSGIKSVLDTRVGQIGLEAAQKGMETYQDFKKAYPEAAEALEAGGNLAQFAFIKKGTQVAGKGLKEGKNIVSDIGMETNLNIFLKKSPEALDNEISKVVAKGIEKGIRPSISGKATAPAYKGYMGKAKNAVIRIIENKANLKLTDDAGNIIEGQLPETLSQFGDAIHQTKKALFQEYHTMAKQAGQQGATIDLRPISAQLKRMARNKALQDSKPEVVKYLLDLADRYKARGKYTVLEAEDAIAQFNKSLDAFYKNPGYDTATKAGIDAIVAENMRVATDKAISSLQGAGYQELKNAYGSLKSIEKEVMQRAIVDLRKNTKGLIDFTDIFSVYAGIRGLLRLDPATITAATGATYAKHLFKKWNDPNYIVKNMFRDTEKLKHIKDFGREPKSNLFNWFRENRNRDIISLDADGNEIPPDITDIVPRNTKVKK